MIKNPLIKFFITVSFIFSVALNNNIDLDKLLLHRLIIVIFISMYKINLKTFFKKFLLLTPFILIFSITLLFGKKEPIINIKIFNFLNFNLSSNFLNFFSVVLKSLSSLLAIVFLIETTNFIDLMKSFKILRIPNEIVNTIFLIFRYFYVLLDDIKKMEIARDMRYFGGHLKRQIKVYSNIIGVLLLRSIEKSERVFNAMKLRGYDKEIRYIVNFELDKKEILFFSLILLILILIKII